MSDAWTSGRPCCLRARTPRPLAPCTPVSLLSRPRVATIHALSLSPLSSQQKPASHQHTDTTPLASCLADAHGSINASTLKALRVALGGCCCMWAAPPPLPPLCPPHCCRSCLDPPPRRSARRLELDHRALFRVNGRPDDADDGTSSSPSAAAAALDSSAVSGCGPSPLASASSAPGRSAPTCLA